MLLSLFRGPSPRIVFRLIDMVALILFVEVLMLLSTFFITYTEQTIIFLQYIKFSLDIMAAIAALLAPILIIVRCSIKKVPAAELGFYVKECDFVKGRLEWVATIHLDGRLGKKIMYGLNPKARSFYFKSQAIETILFICNEMVTNPALLEVNYIVAESPAIKSFRRILRKSRIRVYPVFSTFYVPLNWFYKFYADVMIHRRFPRLIKNIQLTYRFEIPRNQINEELLRQLRRIRSSTDLLDEKIS